MGNGATDSNSSASQSTQGAGLSSIQIDQVVDGKYRIIQKLGEGGMGGVYRAEHLLMNRSIALKVLHSNLLDNEDSRKRFLHEARIASRISHPHAVTIFDFGLDGEMPYIAMEFISGRTLKHVIAEEGRLSLDRICGILGQVADALSHAHQLGIVHRDLKPDNIMVSKREEHGEWVNVLDFGIAKLIQQGENVYTLMTQAGMFFGTPQYMAPEATGKQFDARSDIYSLGIILYEMISGEVPFKAPSLVQVLMKQLTEQPVPLRKFKPELKLARAVDSVVMRTLEKDPSKRYQSLPELVRDFQRAAQFTREGVGTQSTITRINSPLPPALPSSRMKYAGPALFAVVFAATAVASWHYHSGLSEFLSRQFSSGGAGAVRVVSAPSGADVYLDGIARGRTPMLLQGVQGGSHELLLKKSAHGDIAISLHVKPERTTEFNASLMPLLEEEKEGAGKGERE